MPQAAAQHEPTDTAPAPGSSVRGIRAGELRTRAGEGAAAAASGAPVSASFDAETLSFDFTLLTTRSCPSYRYILYEGSIRPEYTEVEEQLDMVGCEGLDELVGSSILNSHRYWSIEDVVGVIETAAVEGDALNCRGRLSRRPEVAGIAQDLADGILRSVSGGFNRIEETLTLREGLAPLVTVTRWQPREASLVPVPADPSARIRSGAPNVSQSAKIVAAPASGQRAEGDAAPTPEEAKAAAEAVVTAAKAAVAAAEKALADLTPADAGAGAEADAAKAEADKKAEAEKAAGERSAKVDALRSMARRKGGDVLADFEDLAAGGASVERLQDVCVASVATRGGDISGISGARSGGGQGAAKPSLLTRSAYAALRAGSAN